MTDLISDRIKEVEGKWLNLVKPYTRELFSETFLPSHDHKHHQRVWNISKKLLIGLDTHNSRADQDLVEGILLAAWFHDTGMVKDRGIRHGALGKEIFESFMEDRTGVDVPRYEEIKDAIEFHDTKDPSAYPKLKPGTAPGILGVLSVADDMDALGMIGIYRYVEIYLERDIPLQELGKAILTNVQKRFRNIRESCAALDGLTDPYHSSFLIIEEFFTLLNQQVMLEKEVDRVSGGHLGIVNLIRSFSVESSIRPEYFMDQPELHSTEDFIKNYFNELHRELELSDC